MRRLMSAALVAAVAGAGLLLGAGPAAAHHACHVDLPCYPHLCVNPKPPFVEEC